VTAASTPAIGGTRAIPVPDPVARDYLLLAMRLDQHAPGTVVSYFGPADVKAQVDLESLRRPARLREDAGALLDRIRGEVTEPDRRAWLEAQVVALETQAARLGGHERGWNEVTANLLGVWVEPVPEHAIAALVAEAEALLPGTAPLSQRLAAWQADRLVPPEAVVDAARLVAAVAREGARGLWGLPDRERVEVRGVRGQPWRAFNWYDGGRRSRVDINLDRAVTWPDLVHVVGHETYLGHHLEQLWREVDHVERSGHLEASVVTIDTPECLVSEGLAQVLPGVALSAGDQAELLVRLHSAGGGPPGSAASASEEAVRDVAIAATHRALAAARVNATILRHLDGAPGATVMSYLEDAAGFSADEAARAADAIEDPYRAVLALTYPVGASLVEAWVRGAPEVAPAERLGRLLHERLTPAGLLAEAAV
jgi:hypothetical protein